jgi:hypothetical protein
MPGTAGIVSAKLRALDDASVEFLQKDAAVNPGNKGSAHRRGTSRLDPRQRLSTGGTMVGWRPASCAEGP